MTKVKVIEVVGTKLDPNSKYLIVFNSHLLTIERMSDIAQQLKALGVDAAYSQCVDPEKALKVYEIPELLGGKVDG